MRFVLELVAVTVLLTAVQEGLRRGGRWGAMVAFLVLPLVLTPYWLTANHFEPFAWVKLYTVLMSAGWYAAVRHTALGRHAWALRVAAGLFVLNILEAAAFDLVAWRLPQAMNAVAAILLVATHLPRGAAVRVDFVGRYRDLHWHGLDRGWVAGFTLWNWTFLYLNFPTIVGHHTAVLGAASLVGCVAPRRWVQARMSILAVDLMAFATCGPTLVQWVDTSHWQHSIPEPMVAAIALACAIGYSATVASTGATSRVAARGMPGIRMRARQ